MARRSDRPQVHYALTPAWMAWACFSNLALHAIVFASLRAPAPLPSLRKRESVVAFEVVAPQRVAEPPRVDAEPPATPERESVPIEPSRARAPVETPSEPAPRPEPRDPTTETLDLSGLTLTNPLGTGFAMPAGNGRARETALRAPASLGREKHTPPPPLRPSAAGPALVPVSDLSSRPTPPALDAALERNYPEHARQRGLGGSAEVRLRIDPDGVVRSVAVLSESASGFGEACRRTLRGTRWSAPRDRSGRAVATEVRTTCRFQVTR